MEIAECDAVLFGLDGVLTDVTAWRVWSWRATSVGFLDRYLGYGNVSPPYSVADYHRYFHGRPLMAGLAVFLASRDIHLPVGTRTDSGRAFTLHGIINMHRYMFRQSLRQKVPRAADMCDILLTHLRRHDIRVAVVSGTGNTDGVLRAIGVRHHIDVVVDDVTADILDIPCPPMVAAYRCAALQFDLNPQHTLVVEANPRATEAAANAGFQVVSVDPTYNPAGPTHHGTAVIRGVSELIVSELTSAEQPGMATTA